MSSKSSTSLPKIESRFVSSSTSSGALTVAAERWNVEKKRIELDEDIEKFYNAQVAKCLSIDKVANEKITKLYNDIYYKVKWSNPPLPAPIQKLYTEYSKHLLTEGTKTKFTSMVDLKVWKKKVRGSVHDKAFGDIDKQCKNLRDVILKRDTDLIETQATLLSTTEKKNVKKDGTLRWMMESNVGKKDEYFTIWYLAANCKIRELDVLLNAPSKQVHIDQRDPDFGLTPLHYACKTVKLSMVQYLMSQGADLTLRTPDGRTVLHLAAAYSSREVVQELLGACVDFDAVDNYGCTALQMAVQNRNTKTMEILGNWTKLTLLPEERAALEQQQQAQNLLSTSLSKFRSSSVEIGFESMMSKLSPSRIRGEELPTVSSALLQESVYIDPSIPEEYQPIPADTIKLMSPTLSLLTKRLNAYNMYFVRNEANYVPTEMLRSRDLSHISDQLHRSAAQAESLAYGSLSATPTYSVEPSIADGGYYANMSSERAPAEPASHQVGFPPSVDSFVYLDTGDSYQNDTQESSQLEVVMSPISGAPTPGVQHFSFRSIFDNQMLNPSDIFRSGSSFIENNDFGTLFNECLVEIRLVSKHYALCVQENLIDEAMRSLRRRWLVAKRLWDLIVQEKKRKHEAAEARRAQQERDMEALLSQQENYTVTYNEAGEPNWHSAGQLEQSTLHESSGESDDIDPFGNKFKMHPQLLENSSELATFPSPPRLMQRSSTSGSIGVRSPSRFGADSPLTINIDAGPFTDSNLDINHHIVQNQGK